MNTLEKVNANPWPTAPTGWISGSRFLLICGGVYLATAFATLYLPYPIGSIATVWYPNAIAICLLLTRSPREWPLLLVVIGLANFCAGIFAGGNPMRTIQYIPGNLVEIALGSTLLRTVSHPRECVTRVEGLLRALLLGGMFPAALGAAVGTLFLHHNYRTDPVSTWTSLFGGSAIGSVAILPVGFLCLARGWSAFTPLRKNLWTPLAMSLAILVSIWAPAYMPHPFVYVTVTLALVAVVGHFPAVALATMLCSLLVVIRLGVNTSMSPDLPRELQDVLIYLPLVLTLLPPVLLAAAMERLLMTARELSEEKERAEVTLHSIGDGVVTTDARGRITYLNPVAEQMLDWPLEDAAGREFQQVVHVFDRRTEKSLPDAITRAHQPREPNEVLDNLVLRNREGREYGIRDNVSPILAQDGSLLGTVTVMQDVTETRQLAQKMFRLAHHDGLTDLPNRILYQDRLLHACQLGQRHGSRFAVIFMDLDHFKNINDSLGHVVGDELLQLVAQRLKQTLRSSDTISRLGGDEFVMLLDDMDGGEAAAEFAGNLINTLKQPYMLQGNELVVTTSLGIAMFPEDGQDPSTLMKHADAAMYRSKRDGRNCFHLFSRSADDAALARLTLENDLRRAIQEREFHLLYQPIVDASTRQILSVEALVRWHRSDGSIVRPDRFIPVAEESGLIIPLGRQLLDQACRQLQHWRGTALEYVRVAVNASTVQLREDGFAQSVSETLARHDIDGRQLELEITESTLMTDSDLMLKTLKGLKSLGLRISIDDFGTGYSSLSYLKRFPVDTVKVDRSFVRDMEDDSSDRELIRAILAMSRSLSLEVIAEGVETEGQAGILADMGCPLLQGYLFAKPCDADTLLALAHTFTRADGSNWTI